MICVHHSPNKTSIFNYFFNDDVKTVQKYIDKSQISIFSNYSCDAEQIHDIYELTNNKHINVFQQNKIEAFFEESKFNKTIGDLPNNIIKLNTGNGFNQNVDNLPRYLKILCLGENFKKKINNFPNLLNYFELFWIPDKPHYLPNSIEKLIFEDNSVFYLINSLNLVNLVNSITEIK